MRKTKIRNRGKYSRLQQEWNRSIRENWAKRFGVMPLCCWSGQPGVVVGHIESVQLRPDLRMDARNVAPIAPWVNDRMRTDLEFRVKVQEKMRYWVSVMGLDKSLLAR